MKNIAASILVFLGACMMIVSVEAQPPDIGGEQVFVQAPDNPGIPPGRCSDISQIILGLSGNVTLVAGDTGQFNLPVGVTLCKDVDFFVGNNDSRLTFGLGPSSGPTGNGRFGPIELFRDIEAASGNGVYLRVRGIPGSQSVILTIIGDDTNDWVQLGGGDKELSLRLRLFDRALWSYNNTKFMQDAASGWLFEDVNGNGKIFSGDGDRPMRTALTSDKNDDNAICVQTPVEWTDLILAAFESQDILNPGISKWDFTNDPGFEAGDNVVAVANILVEPEGLLARFTAAPLVGTAPLTVSFTDRSSGFPTSWFWDFGDGIRSFEQNPIHTYTTAGTYAVSLRVSSATGSHVGTNADYIVVYRPGALAGVVTDAFTGFGIAEATVTLNPGNYQSITISSITAGRRGDYTLSGIPVGSYTAEITAAGYKTLTENGIAVASGAKTTLNVALTPTAIEKKLSVITDPPCGTVGNPIVISAHAAGGGHLYQYVVDARSFCETEQRNWEVIQDWTTDTSAIWIPEQSGRHTIVVKVTDDIADTCLQTMGVSYEVGGDECIDPVAISLSPATGAANEPISIRAVGGREDLQYAFWSNRVSLCDPSQPPNWELVQDWSSSDNCTFTPDAETIYTLAVWTAEVPGDPCQGIGGVTYSVSSRQGGEASWSFNEGGGMVVYDASGSGNDGVIHSATRGTGHCGGGLQFDGIDDYVEIPDHSSLDVANGITLMSWIKLVPAPSSGAQTIVSKNENGTLSVSSGRTIIGWLGNTRGDVFQVSGATRLSTDTWHHVALSAAADATLKVYVDGIEDGSAPTSGILMTNADSLQIGNRKQLPESFFRGAIDDVHLYNRALSAPEIQEAMECGVGTLTGYVRDRATGQNVGSAKVVVLPGSFAAVTEQNSPFGTTGGEYRIENIPEGIYAVSVTKEGYVPNTQSSVMIGVDEISTLNIVLNPRYR